MAQTPEDKAAAEVAAAEEETAAKINSSKSAVATETIAYNALHDEIVRRVADELRDRVNSGKPEGFAGQNVVSDNFSVATTEAFGVATVEIKPAGWVGDGFRITGKRVKELAKLLGQLKNLPEQE